MKPYNTTLMRRRLSLRSDWNVLMASIMTSNIADGFIRNHVHNYASLHGSIYYIEALKVHVWCTTVL